MNFFAIDVETANADYSSICQIGIVEFKNGEIINKWSQLIDPEVDFDIFNVMIHGIGEDDVKGAPNFKHFMSEMVDILSNKYIVHHMPFDRTAINRACNNYNIPHLDVTWIDSARVVRRTWSQFSQKGYGLANITSFLDIKLDNHHDALCDAIAAGEVLLKALEINPISLDEIHKKSIYRKPSAPIRIDGVEGGVLSGETVVFTGTLSRPRIEMAEIASSVGCDVHDNVTKKTTLLVVGIQDEYKLNGYTKSGKQRKAEQMIQKGQEIRILSESDFYETAELD